MALQEENKLLGTRRFLGACTAVAMAISYGAGAQNFPSKPIRIVASGVGGGSDFAIRAISSVLPASLGQPVIIDNRPGGVIPGDIVAKAPPDGYTLLVSTGILWLAPFLQDNVPYDPIKDFAPVVLINRAPNVLVVHPSVQARSVRELIDLAKANPGKLNYSSGQTGASNHMAAELFKAMVGVNIVRIAYKSSSTEIADLLGGQTQHFTFGTVGAVSPHVKSARIIALAVTSPQPSALFPGLPTVAASGVPGYESGTIAGLWAPARTPAPLVRRLNQEIVRVLEKPEIRERYLAAGSEVVASTPEQFAAVIKADAATWGKLIKSAGIRAE